VKECEQTGIDGRTCLLHKDICYWMSHLQLQNPDALHKDIAIIKKSEGCVLQEECLEYIQDNRTDRK
jgi:hypothetical protein